MDLATPLRKGAFTFGAGTLSPTDLISFEASWFDAIHPSLQIWNLRFDGLDLVKGSDFHPSPLERLGPMLDSWRTRRSVEERRTLLLRAYYLTRNLITLAPLHPNQDRAYAQRCSQLVFRYLFVTGFLLQFGEDLGLSTKAVQQLLHHASEDLARLYCARLYWLSSAMERASGNPGTGTIEGLLLGERLPKDQDRFKECVEAYYYYQERYEETKSPLLAKPDQFESIGSDVSAGALFAFWKASEDKDFNRAQLPPALEKALIPDPYYLPTLLLADQLLKKHKAEASTDDLALRRSFFTIHLRLAHLYVLSGMKEKAGPHMKALIGPTPRLGLEDSATLDLLKQYLAGK